jgi:hypothetical protein
MLLHMCANGRVTVQDPGNDMYKKALEMTDKVRSCPAHVCTPPRCLLPIKWLGYLHLCLCNGHPLQPKAATLA